MEKTTPCMVDVLKFCILPEEPELERVSPPEATPGYVIWILVSDSSCALITGRRHTLRKYDLAEHFKERKPGYVSEFIHEMMWGKTLRQLVKRGVELAADARTRYGDGARINGICPGSEMSASGRMESPRSPIGHTMARTAIGRRS